MWGQEYVITSLLDRNSRLRKQKERIPLSWGYSRPNPIRNHAPRLPGRRPSSVVHLFRWLRAPMHRVSMAPGKGGDSEMTKIICYISRVRSREFLSMIIIIIIIIIDRNSVL